jgi:hypothetical protein
MTLQELIARHAHKAEHGVPDWMPGFWKRYSISYANGMTDLHTHVCWMQSRNFTIDLRLPLEKDQVQAKALDQYSADELQLLANYEGWKASSIWDGNQLSWGDTEATLQLHNRWPEPAVLWRTGNSMIEHCPSNIYMEDWRLQTSASGALVGLHLIEEREVSSGKLRHRGGGLIVCGDYAALTLGRVEQPVSGKLLKTLVAEAGQDMPQLEALFNFETSVAIAGPDGSYQIMLSTQPARVGTEIFPLTGFEVLADQRVRQTLILDGLACERIFEIDTIERNVAYAQATPATDAAQAWFDKESATLGRYLETLT